MFRLLLLVPVFLFLIGCAPVTGERMVRIVETGATARYIPLASGEVGGVRVETSAEPLVGNVQIIYRGKSASINYVSGGEQ